MSFFHHFFTASHAIRKHISFHHQNLSFLSAASLFFFINRIKLCKHKGIPKNNVSIRPKQHRTRFAQKKYFPSKVILSIQKNASHLCPESRDITISLIILAHKKITNVCLFYWNADLKKIVIYIDTFFLWLFTEDMAANKVKEDGCRTTKKYAVYLPPYKPSQHHNHLCNCNRKRSCSTKILTTALLFSIVGSLLVFVCTAYVSFKISVEWYLD